MESMGIEAGRIFSKVHHFASATKIFTPLFLIHSFNPINAADRVDPSEETKHRLAWKHCHCAGNIITGQERGAKMDKSHSFVKQKALNALAQQQLATGM